MIHHAHGATSGPSCIAYDNLRTTKDLVVTGLTFLREHVTCPNCLIDTDDLGNVTEEASLAQNALAYDPLDFSHVPEDPSVIFTDPTIIYTVIVCPTDVTGDVTRRDNPDQPGFAMEGFVHLAATEARIYAEHHALINGMTVVYNLVEFPRHLPAHQPVAYRDRSTWYQVI